MSEFEEDRPEGDGSEGQAAPDTPSPAAPGPAPALREDQIQNAMAFLSHPKVRASSAPSKREFLQRKGLTEAEIDEAFRRVPEQPSAAASTPAAPSTAAPSAVHSTLQHLQPQGIQPPQQQQPVSYLQPQQQQQHLQMVHGQPQQHAGYGPGAMVVAAAPEQQGVRWTQAVLGAGFLAASAYAAKALVWPYVEGAYWQWRGHPRPPPRPQLDSGEATRSAEATQAMADAIAAQTTELRASIDSIRQLVAALEASQQAAAVAAAAADGGAAPPGDGLTVSDLRQELRSFAETLHEIASPKPAATPGAPAKLESELGEIKTLLAELLRSPRFSGSHSPTAVSGRAAPGSKAANGDAAATPTSATSALWRAGGADSSAPGQLDSTPFQGSATQPSAGVIGAGGALGSSSALSQRAQQHDEVTPARSQQTAAGPTSSASALQGDETPKPPPHPASYMEVLEMLEKGQTPPGIRTDINDKPPNPTAAPPAPKLKPRPKPWERGAASQGGGSLASSLGATGGSTGSLGSLGGGGSTATPLAAPWHAAGAGAGAAASGAALASVPATTHAEPAGAIVQAAQAPANEGMAAQQQVRLSPVRAPSPADEAALEAAQGEQAPAQAGQDAALQQGQGQGSPAVSGGGGGSFHSPRRAASIFDAVAPATDSPHIIAGRLSPGRNDSLARSGSSSSLGAGQPMAAAAAATGSFASILAATKERASFDAGLGGEGPLVPAPLEGSGIGRPISRNWRPPPIPAPTLSGGSGAASGPAALAPGASAPAAGGPSGVNGSADAHPAAGSGMSAGDARAVSAASLGEDFASA